MTKIELLEKLNNLLQKADTLPAYQPNSNQEYDKWYRKIEYTLESIPHMTKYFNEHKDLKFIDNPQQQGLDKVWGGTTELNKYHKAINDSKALIESVMDRVNEWDKNISFDLVTTKFENITVNVINVSDNTPKTKVFIVHGHDELAIVQVSEILRKLGLEPIVLRDEPSKGNTIIEKIERLSNEVGFGVVLYTACDVGGKTPNQLKSRARQNVVLEHGYLMARLGRENTMALVKDKVETPSDISGLVYTQMDEHGGWQYKLVEELKASGYSVSKDSI
ncbi:MULTISPECIES: nucleotide-binding protein [unclassified Sulfurospirillum]|uniref:TIR domain-containing protein n=1 Tax=unclassified Sulfurospirillum TaxID=2618290 RepID=UPI00068929AA|nr:MULTISPECIES: nucleotide-binding protein [unclassified Sulfurospirillum]